MYKNNKKAWNEWFEKKENKTKVIKENIKKGWTKTSQNIFAYIFSFGLLVVYYVS